ncbi:unnamed protein product [Rodentolepis nana]|uniref:SCP domain-containing protein n=1 Tax=Rodentolepis nana TaxID=102285 RepID=A0A0R3TLL0_RODNA|nr:unnamed protein product [Rodentolepis nana]
MERLRFKVGVAVLLCVSVGVKISLSEEPSWAERAELLEFHKKIRENVRPTAADMRVLSYSYDMQQEAENWVRKCTKEFPEPNKDPKYFQTVATMPISTNAKPPTVMEMTNMWVAEKKLYNYNTNSCSGQCLNYPRPLVIATAIFTNNCNSNKFQLIWAHSTSFGCAKKKCDGKLTKDKKPFYIFSCAYEVALLPDGEKPYLEGGSCSQCPERSTCHRHQCLQASKSR